MPRLLPDCPLARLDDDFGLHRIGDEALLVRLLVQLGELLGRGRGAAENRRRPQRNARDRQPAGAILLEHAYGVISVAVDDELAGADRKSTRLNSSHLGISY